MPALFTRASIWPNSASVRSTIARRSSLAVTSVCTTSARRPRPRNSDAVRSALARSSSATTMSAPMRASSSAVARPMPRPAPVTIATCSCSSIYFLLCGSQSQGLATELFGPNVPRERGVMRGRVSVTMKALDRLRLHHRAGAAALEQPVDGLHAELGHERLVAAVAGAIGLVRRLTARGLVEQLADVVALERAGRVDFRRRLGQTQLERRRLRGAPRRRGLSHARGELVDGALRDADNRCCQIP